MRRALWLLVLGACGGGGPGGVCGLVVDARSDEVATLTVGSDSFAYGGFRWGQNNDCTSGSVVSVTIRGGQVAPAAAAGGLGLCLPRPDLVGDAPIDLGDTSRVQLVGATAQGGACTTTPAERARPSGTVTFTGFCTTAGTAYELALAGQIAGTRTCAGAAPEAVTIALGGKALVVAQ
jgi:hypothetical protein